MTSDRDTERLVETWLEETARPLPPHVLEAALDALPRTARQRRSSWFPFDLSSRRSLAVALVAVAVVVIALGPSLISDLGPTFQGIVGRPGPSTPIQTAFHEVTGQGRRINAGTPTAEFTVDARTTATGAQGSYSFHHLTLGVAFDGTVSCLRVSGNEAALGGTIMASSGPSPTLAIGGSFLVFLTDHGSPTPGKAGPDVTSQTYILPGDASVVSVPSDFPTTCPDPTSTAHDAYIVDGDLAITGR